MEQASELFRSSEDHALLRSLQTAGIAGEVGSVDELSVKFEEHIDQLEEVHILSPILIMQLKYKAMKKVFL